MDAGMPTCNHYQQGKCFMFHFRFGGQQLLWLLFFGTWQLISYGSQATTQAEDISAGKRKARPNIVLIISDDAGYVDFGFQGSKDFSTPELDRLAQQGVRFTNAYAASVCSPSRASLVTGMYYNKIGYDFNIPTQEQIIGTGPTIGLKPDQRTMFDEMKTLGYNTYVVGKWHLGMHQDNVQNEIFFKSGNRPPRMGVDQFWGLLGGSRPYWCGQAKGADRLVHLQLGPTNLIEHRDIEDDYSGQYVTDVLGQLSCDLIQQGAAEEPPFLLYISFTAPHTPMQGKEEHLEMIDQMGNELKGRRRVNAAMTYSMDENIGRIMNALADPNQDGNRDDSILDNTLIIFINDNGGDCCDDDPNGSSNGPLRGGKGGSFEGAFRVPMLIVGAGVDNSLGGTDFDHPVHTMDIFPTMVAAAGGMPVDDLDGVDLLPFVNGETEGIPHESIYLRRGVNQQCSLRMGKWKLHHNAQNRFRLFDLETNLGEKEELDLSSKFPEIVEQMQRMITDYDVRMDRPHWNVANLHTRHFRFRESVDAENNWSKPEIWTDDISGACTLTEWDGFADTTLIFRNRERGEFISINDMRRQSGLEFMANQLVFRSYEGKHRGDAVGIIKGQPLLMVNSLKGKFPSIQFGTQSPFRTEFDLQLKIIAYSDFKIMGDGNGIFRLSGGIDEYNPGLRITKTGTSTVYLGGNNQLTGIIEVEAGELRITTARALGCANVIVRSGARFVAELPLLLSPGQTITGEGEISIVK